MSPAGRVAGALALALGVLTGTGWAGRPLDTEDTETLEPGGVEVELSTSWERAGREHRGEARAVLNLGLPPGRLELNLEVPLALLAPGDGTAEVGAGDLELVGKYRVLDETGPAPAALLRVGLRLPSGDEQRGLGEAAAEVAVVPVAAKSLGPVRLTANAGYAFVTAERALDAWLLSASAEWRVAPALTLVGEAVGEVGARGAPDTLVLRAGAAWALGERVRLDAAVGAGLTRASPDVVATLGVTLGFK